MKTIHDFYKRKSEQKKISMVTCYDYSFAKIVNDSNIDTILIGDSIAQVIYGYPSTLHATVSMIALHVEAVAKGAPQKFIVADMPFLSTRLSLEDTLKNAATLMKAGAHCVKIEGADSHLEIISRLVEVGIPVMGHLGLTPQSIHQLGGAKIQGRSNEQAEKIKSDALALEKAGCFSLVLECVPYQLAQSITELVNIATIGIGAGSYTDGQVLVLQDLLGLNPKFNPKFLKKYAELHQPILESFNRFHLEVQSQKFPKQENSYE